MTAEDAVQRVCPHCSTLSYTADRRCPWCGRSYTRRIWPALMVAIVIQTALLLGAGAYGASLAQRELDTRINEEVTRVQDDLDASFKDVQRQVSEELDRRIPSVNPGGE